MASERNQTLRLTGQMIDLVNPGQLAQPDDRLLPTPAAKLGEHGGSGPDHARLGRAGATGADLPTALAGIEPLPDKVLLPTPTRQDGSNDGGPSQFHRHKLPLNTQIKVLERAPGAQDDESQGVIELLPTPTCPAPHDTENTAGALRARRDGYGAELTTIFQPGTGELLPTPKASDGDKGGPNQRGSSGDYALPAVAKLLPTPKAGDGEFVSGSTSGRPVEKSTHLGTQALLQAGHLEHRRTPEPEDGPLLPTPCANDSGNTPEEHLAKKPGRTQVTSLQIIADHGLIETGGKLLPTPLAGDAKMTRNSTANRTSEPPTGIHAGDTLTDALVPHGDADAPVTKINWGAFEPAIRRWERVIGRPAPAPTEPSGKNGNHRLSPRFVEWMMGLDQGHVTGVGLKRNQELKALGNGVVPQQGAYAIRHLLGRSWLYTKVDGAREAA